MLTILDNCMLVFKGACRLEALINASAAAQGLLTLPFPKLLSIALFTFMGM